jgi:hypothetical protein
VSELEIHPGHIDVERLLAFAHGEVVEPEAGEIRQHASACPECGDELAVMLALRIGPAGNIVPAPQVGHDTMAPPDQRRLKALLAASVVFVAVLGTLMMSGIFDTELPDVAGLATTVPPDRVDLDFLFGQVVPASTVGTARAGFALIVDGRFEDAVRLLSPLNEARPGDDEVATGLGIALYLSDDSSVRAEWLLAQGGATRREDLSHYAKWYLGNLYLRRGDVAQATLVLEDISTESDFPGTWARQLLRRLWSENS